MTAPDVSIIVPTRNRAGLLLRAVSSARAQTMPAWEMIIVDDASTDDTAGLIEAVAADDARIRKVRIPEPMGAASARNLAVSMARGEYVAFLDDDDEWLPGKLERQLAVLGAAPAVTALAHGAFIEVDEHGAECLAGEYAADHGDALDQLLRGNVLGHSTVMLRRSVFLSSGGFDEKLPRLQDWDLWIRVAMISRFVAVPGTLARIHLTPGSISRQQDALRRACDIMAGKYQRHTGLLRPQYAELCYALGQLLVRHGDGPRGRRYIRRALCTYPWPPSRIAGGLLSQLAPQTYRTMAALHDRTTARQSSHTPTDNTAC